MTRTTQLRRYELKPHLVEAFLEWWPTTLVPAREAAGFRIEFAYFDPEVREFTWAVSTEGDAEDFARIEAAYNASEGRAAAFAGLSEGWTDASRIAIVEQVA
ncbi:hypothetical protein ACDF64_12680 [Agromyces sp. MMS24-JH15]|uniref:hypothetical protein n=1 Tax=Agromyces sp. MMS24-JH15 TaxID=3243765 RepID=UPI003748250D